jgi:hypothetical protein
MTYVKTTCLYTDRHFCAALFEFASRARFASLIGGHTFSGDGSIVLLVFASVVFTQAYPLSMLIFFHNSKPGCVDKVKNSSFT